MIIDSSSLIIFAKIKKIDILLKLYKTLSITKEIYKETVEQGIAINAPDAKIIKEFVESKKIKIKDLDKTYAKLSKELRSIYSQLGFGESEAIALTLQEGDNLLIMDEGLGRDVAKLYSLKPIGSLRILLEAYKENILDEEKLRETVREMIKNKFRLGAEVIDEFWRIFDKIKKKKIN
ncbi:DUF3368 domain-containing protein [Candidatus Woesearchaeota archaeon]|nr:DUF3368 domain-containing protein [Candidatus Woesearchaeota archaeon]